MANTRLILTSLCVVLWPLAVLAQGGFAVTPTWEGVKACSGRPITSPSPAFSLAGVPANTAELEFRMVDLDAPSFNHGGGKVRYAGRARIPPGAFQFIGPCPPQTHRYDRSRWQWQVAWHGTGDQELPLRHRKPSSLRCT